MIYTSSDEHRVEHMASARDVDAGQARRPVRRPSDMVNTMISLFCVWG
jgi:hypothetical protein